MPFNFELVFLIEGPDQKNSLSFEDVFFWEKEVGCHAHIQTRYSPVSRVVVLLEEMPEKASLDELVIRLNKQGIEVPI